jgi:hypothetical protein
VKKEEEEGGEGGLLIHYQAFLLKKKKRLNVELTQINSHIRDLALGSTSDKTLKNGQPRRGEILSFFRLLTRFKHIIQDLS